MLRILKDWHRRRILRRHPVPDGDWLQTLAALPLLTGLEPVARARLRLWVTLFLQEKDFFGARGLVPTDTMRLTIAAQACLPILNLDLDWYRGWSSIILYPDTFVASRTTQDAAGVVHTTRHALAGEAWDAGPVILSWADARPGHQPHGPGTNVVIHEFAHKLDMLDGAANGCPPLHRDMDRALWTRVFDDAYRGLCAAVEAGQPTAIDPYGAASPAEFFAVVSECFFTAPERLQATFPQIHDQLVRFYRQRPPAIPAPVV